MTELLFLKDAYLREFTATVAEITDGGGVALDRTAFYSGGGGQPSDTGTLTDAAGSAYTVAKVGRSGGKIVHTLDGDHRLQPGAAVSGAIDWERRYLLMRTHTALHILCGVVWRDYGALVTGGDMRPGRRSGWRTAPSCG